MTVSVVFCCAEGCDSQFSTEDAVSPNVKYICRKHTPTEQTVFFQEHAFDKELDGSHSPSGTENDSYDAGAEANQE